MYNIDSITSTASAYKNLKHALSFLNTFSL